MTGRLPGMAHSPTGRPLDVLVVASWFPAIDDSTRGRFVADQVQALQATGRVSPSVASFELLDISGGPASRRRQLGAIQRNLGPVIRDDDGLFNGHGSHSPDGIPVARIPVAGGRWVGGGIAHGSLHRDRALRVIADRQDRPAWSLIHAHTGYPDGAGSIRLAEQLGVPLVITEHATFVGRILGEPSQRRAYIAGVRAAARFVAVSRSLADELVAAIPEIEAKLVVIPNTVDVGAFLAVPNVERRPDELLYVGYRTETKAIDVLLAALREIRTVRPGATLRLIGRSPDEPTELGWLRMAAELGIAEAVTFEPPALRAQVAEAMARASLLVHASRRETFGVTSVEALAAGLPVIAADTGPLREILGDDSSLGVLAPAGDPQAFAAAVLQALDRRASFDPALLRAAVVERFGAAAVANRLADLYLELVELAPKAAGPVVRRPRSSEPHGEPPRDGPSSTISMTPVGPGAAGAEPQVLVIGFTTATAARLLGPLPPSLLRCCRLLCGAGPGEADLPPGLGATILIDLEGPHHQTALAIRNAPPRGSRRDRVVRLLRDPLGVISRRSARARWESFRVSASQAAVVAELATIRASGAARPIEVIALDGRDHVALEASLAADIRLLPGSVRWLADRAAQRPPGDH